MAIQLLECLKKELIEEGMDCTILEESDENPIPRLLVYLGADDKRRDRTMEITADAQILPAHFKDFQHMQVEEGFYRLQIQSLFPFDFNPHQAANVSSCINFINGLLELPGLYSDEVQNKILYRCVQLTSKQELHKTLLVGIIGMHRMVLDIFAQLLEKIGSGEMTYFEFLDEVVKYTNLQTKKLHA